MHHIILNHHHHHAINTWTHKEIRYKKYIHSCFAADDDSVVVGDVIKIGAKMSSMHEFIIYSHIINKLNVTTALSLSFTINFYLCQS